jgi:hypothetical protein
MHFSATVKPPTNTYLFIYLFTDLSFYLNHFPISMILSQ